MSVTRVLMVIAICGWSVVFAAPVPKDGKLQVEPISHYRFDGDAKNEIKDEAEFELKNTEFEDKALSLNGVYELGGGPDGYHAVCKTPKLDYEKFTVALRFKAEEFGESKSNLLTGGTGYRWFTLERSAGGNLVVTFNNHDFKQEVEGAALETGKWTVVVCSVDVPGKKATVALNGKKPTVIDLPKDFHLSVINTNAKETDNVWSFTNYSNGNVFHGLVDELLIYGQALSVEELKKIPLRP